MFYANYIHKNTHCLEIRITEHNRIWGTFSFVVYVVLFKSWLTLLWPYGLYPTRIFCPGDFSGKNTGVGLPLPDPGNLPDPGIKPSTTAWLAASLPLSQWEATSSFIWVYMNWKVCFIDFHRTSLLPEKIRKRDSTSASFSSLRV